MRLKEKIQALSEEYHQDVVSIRRYLHINPELSFHEYETSKFIQKKLDDYSISFQSGIANTGVVALICSGSIESPTDLMKSVSLNRISLRLFK